jgi:hypothetical protein
MAVDMKRASECLIILSTGLHTLADQFNSYNRRFQVLMTVNIMGPVLCNVMQCTVVDGYQCFEKECAVSSFMEVIHHTTHHHMPEDNFLKNLKFYTAH